MSNRATKIVGAGVPPSAASQIAGDVQGGVTAAGTTQATATAAYGDNVVVTTCPAGAGIILGGPAFGNGDDVFVANQGANACLVYPPVGYQINSLGVNAGFSVAAGKAAMLRSTGSLQFYSLLSA
jgi:hypothetical protein